MRWGFQKDINHHALRVVTGILAVFIFPFSLFANETTPNLTWKTFQDKKIAIAFTYPSNTHPKINYLEKNIDLYSNLASQNADPLVSFTLYSGDFNHVNQQLGMFNQQGNKWITTWGRNFSGSIGEPISTVNGHGFIANVICGITDIHGNFHASGDCILGLISDAKNSMDISTTNLAGGIITEKTVKKIIHSVTFLPFKH